MPPRGGLCMIRVSGPSGRLVQMRHLAIVDPGRQAAQRSAPNSRTEELAPEQIENSVERLPGRLTGLVDERAGQHGVMLAHRVVRVAVSLGQLDRHESVTELFTKELEPLRRDERIAV